MEEQDVRVLHIVGRPVPTAFFLTVEWCRDGLRGVFCRKDGECFRKDGEPHTDEEMWEILGPFFVILDPKSEPFIKEDFTEYVWFRPLAEYCNEFGIALKEEQVGENN